MGQYKFWITFKFQIGIKVEWMKREAILIDILCFHFGIGLTRDAHGFGFWLG